MGSSTDSAAKPAGETAGELINYMSSRLLEVAEMNTVLDQFEDNSKVGWNFKFTSLPISSNWIRIVRHDNLATEAKPSEYRSYAFGRDDFEFEPPALETRALSAADREGLERLLPF